MERVKENKEERMGRKEENKIDSHQKDGWKKDGEWNRTERSEK